MKTITIKGKDYVSVNERVMEFHKVYPNGMINCELVNMDNGIALIQAIVTPDVKEPGRTFTGFAYEKEGSTFINKTSYVENCETSAVGRALGFLNIGIDTSIASKEEVENAMENQKSTVKMPQSKSEKEKMVEAFGKIKAKLGDEKFLEILGKFGYTDIKEIANVDEGRAIFTAMEGK